MMTFITLEKIKNMKLFEGRKLLFLKEENSTPGKTRQKPKLKKGHTYVDPSQREEAMLVLNTKKFFYVLHVTVVRARRLLWHNYMGDSKLIMRLENNW